MMRASEKYTVYQPSGIKGVSKESLGVKGQSENINVQNNANAAVPPLSSRRLMKTKEMSVKRKADEMTTEIGSKRRPVEPEEIDMTTKESREKFQKEVEAAMPMVPANPNANDEAEIDIDLADEFDPTLLGLYAKEIFAYLTVVEVHFHFPLNKVSTTLQAKHVEFVQEGQNSRPSPTPVEGSPEYGMNSYTRAKVIDFVSSIHSKMALCNESIFLCVQFLDRINYLEGALGKTDSSLKGINKYKPYKKLISNPYLLGLTCLFIANKYEDRYTPRLRDFIRFTNNKYEATSVIECERKVLKLLDYALQCPTPIVFLRRFCRIDDTQTRERYITFLIGEMCFRSTVLSSLRPSLVAAAILGYVNQMTGKPIWSEKLTMYSNIKEEDIIPIMKNIEHFVKDFDRSFYSSVKNKYSLPRYHGAWEYFVAQVKPKK